MKKWLVYLIVMAAVPILSFGDFGGEDVGRLQPVKVLMVQMDGSSVRLSTDLEHTGMGKDIHAALQEMKDTSTKRIFLDTTDYLLMAEGSQDVLPELMGYLRPSCSVCRVDGMVDLSEAGEFLQEHPPQYTITKYESGERSVPLLVSKGGKMKLVQ